MSLLFNTFLMLVRICSNAAEPTTESVSLTQTSPAPAFAVMPLSGELALQYKLDAGFYRKSTLVQNVLIISSKRVSDYAHLESAYLIDLVMKDLTPGVAQRVRDRQPGCVIVGHNELTSDLPQYPSDKKGKELDFYNWRNRGSLSTINDHPTILVSEEDILEYKGGMWLESVLIHEFAHLIDGAGFDKDLHARLKDLFKQAKEKGLWNDGYAAQRFERVDSRKPVSLFDALVKSFPSRSPELFTKCLDGGDILVNGKPSNSKVKVTKEDKVLIVFGGPKQTYFALNPAEYWAESVQCWYDCCRVNDHDHNHIHTREQIQAYDPEMAKLCRDVLGESKGRFVSPRIRAGTGHLKGYKPDKAPVVKHSEHIRKAGLDYYDEYWKSYWKRLFDKYGLKENPSL